VRPPPPAAAARPPPPPPRAHPSALFTAQSEASIWADEPAAARLDPEDYSFYGRMKAEEVTEAFLWERRLAPLLGYLAPAEVAVVREALSLAHDAHAGQRRRSGEPFITHPVEVTRILAQLRMDHESLAAGLLHDTVEDCGEAVGLEEIGFAFGPAVRRIVEGETKFSKLPTHHPERAGAEVGAGAGAGEGPEAAARDAKARDLQFLFLAMAEEVRIIVVKLADRLHNMRTMGSMPPGKQRRIAQETLAVFAPLARLLGLYTVKEELEELGFRYALPQQHALTARAAARLWDAQRPTAEAAAAALRARLAADPFLAERLDGLAVEPRTRALYATWRKLQEAGRSVRDLSDVAQLRVVLTPRAALPPPGAPPAAPGAPPAPPAPAAAAAARAAGAQLCYHALGLVHGAWAPVPGSMKDYIATPKPNSYQALHTRVVPTGLLGAEAAGAADAYGGAALSGSGNGNGSGSGSGHGNGGGGGRRGGAGLFPIEIQIRTAEMERLASYGIAVESWTCADYARAPGASSSDSEGGGGGGAGPPPAPAAHGGRIDAQTLSRRINWLSAIRAWQAEFVGQLSATEFVAAVTDDLLGQGVFVFTPGGAVMRLPRGATAVDFAYHIHTDVGNAMVAARVNGKVVPAERVLESGEVVEVVAYRGPPNAALVRRHARWLGAARTKTARHKLARFLREHAALAEPAGGGEAGGSVAAAAALGGEAAAAAAAAACTAAAKGEAVAWLTVRCADRPGLLAAVANAISAHGHDIRAYSGRAARRGAGAGAGFAMEYEVAGPPAELGALCEAVGGVEGVEGWAAGCALPGEGAA
jgi:(p)ppGpp synthase/HD superfamily hydrolase